MKFCMKFCNLGSYFFCHANFTFFLGHGDSRLIWYKCHNVVVVVVIVLSKCDIIVVVVVALEHNFIRYSKDRAAEASMSMLMSISMSMLMLSISSLLLIFSADYYPNSFIYILLYE